MRRVRKARPPEEGCSLAVAVEKTNSDKAGTGRRKRQAEGADTHTGSSRVTGGRGGDPVVNGERPVVGSVADP